MNEYLIYSTQGKTIAPNESVSIDNCQLLGRSYGTSLNNAIDNLYNTCNWITKAGFDKSECIGIQILTPTIKEHISQIIEYMLYEGQKHFQQYTPPSDHIFRIIDKLNNHIK